MRATLLEFQDYVQEAQSIYLEDIREGNPQAFTRRRKITPYQLMLQMFAQKGRTQFSELLNFYRELETPLDISTVGFYKARMNYNPKAIQLMMKDYLSMIYENRASSLVKFNGYILTAIDGSTLTLPSSSENMEKYGVTNDALENSPVMARVSVLYDCINKLVIDTCVGAYASSERTFAAKHIDELKEMMRYPTITTFDRGYFSMRLVDQLIENKQKFVLRMDKRNLKRYSQQLSSGEDQMFDMTFDRKQANYYRKDQRFRTKLMNTSYRLRFVKIPILRKDTNEWYNEVLLTNLTQEECSLEGLREIYRLRWEIETVYNVLKNRMKLEEFSGFRERLIFQDIYCCVWLYNLTMLHIMEVNESKAIPQERYKYEMKRNISISIGIIKTYFIQSIMGETYEKREESIIQMENLLTAYLVPIRPDRKARRQESKNKSRRSYRYTY
ncbi:IS4 family transposase [Tetragenococcus halophilus]|uniref:IS4 family transposase n=1 Tax=Tetragenococcus halophilus TaxID=51669 RepID=UPI001B785975|nr:IS4 family transposase [Tetragenococcus halophilus]GLL50199.1 hypothetical protein YA5_001700 [Tetragenococcus halophilus]